MLPKKSRFSGGPPLPRITWGGREEHSDTSGETPGEDPERRHKAAGARGAPPSGRERAGSPAEPSRAPPTLPPVAPHPEAPRVQPEAPHIEAGPGAQAAEQLLCLHAATTSRVSPRRAGSRMYFRERGGGARAAPRCHGNRAEECRGWGRFSEAVSPSVSAALRGARAACTAVGQPELSPWRP